MKLFVFAAASALLALTGCGKKASPDLAFCSPDDAVVMHLRLSDALATDAGKGFLALAKTQTDLAEIEQEFGLKLDQIETITMSVSSLPDEDPENPRILVRTKADFAIQKLFPTMEHEAVKVPGFADAFITRRRLLIQVDPRRFLFMPDERRDPAELKFAFPKTGPLDPALAAINAGDSHLVLGFNPKALEAERMRGPKDLWGELFENGRVPVVELKAGRDLRASVSVFARDADDAAAAGQALAERWGRPSEKVADEFRAGRLLNAFWEMMGGAKVTGSGKSRRFEATVPLDLIGIADGPESGVGTLQHAAAMKNLKQIGRGVVEYYDRNDGPPGIGVVPAGKTRPNLSWRVAILPYIGEGELYKQFKLDEPWDGDHNKKLIPNMPKLFAIPSSDEAVAEAGKTYYRLFDIGVTKLVQIVDGTSNTIAVVEAAEAVEWTKPEGLDPKAKDLHALIRWGWGGGTAANVVMYDGNPKVLRKKISAQTLGDAITPDEGNPLGDDF